MNPDTYDSLIDDYWGWQRRYKEDLDRELEVIDRFYDDDSKFSDEDNKPRYSERDFKRNQAYVDAEIEDRINFECHRLANQYEKEICDLENTIRKLRNELKRLADADAKMTKMENCLRAFELYSEITYDRDTFTLIL